jgi:hypothetical protein
MNFEWLPMHFEPPEIDLLRLVSDFGWLFLNFGWDKMGFG